MTTLEKIKIDGAAVVEKAARLEVLTKNDLSILRIYNLLYSGTSNFSGKRKGSKNVQKVK